ncbi:MAG: RDD family protein [Candidatus Hodarchaeota archaeon]
MSFQPAGFLSRAIAYIIDGIILGFISTPIMAIFVIIPLLPYLSDPTSFMSDPTAMNILFGAVGIIAWIITIALQLIYWTVVPGLLDGQSIGKKLLGIQVRKLMPDGSTESTKGMYVTHFLRWLGWIIDSICCIGCILVLFTERKQRIGDMIAGTIVVD